MDRQKPKAKVYIASPYTKGDTAVNVRVSADVFSLLVDLGCTPFCPLTTHFLHMMNPKPYQTWMDYDFEWVESCDILLRVPGQSSGADKEVYVATEAGIPTARDIISLIDFLKFEGWHINPEITRDYVIMKYNKITTINPDLYI